MTVEQISKRQHRSNVEYDVAKKLRAVLDEAKAAYTKAYGKDSWEDDEVETRALELLSEEED